jgi:hypothetical protein
MKNTLNQKIQQQEFEDNIKKLPKEKLDSIAIEENPDLDNLVKEALIILGNRKDYTTKSKDYGKKLKDVIEMKYFDNKTFKQIANKYGASYHQSAENWYKRALNELKEIIIDKLKNYL